MFRLSGEKALRKEMERLAKLAEDRDHMLAKLRWGLFIRNPAETISVAPIFYFFVFSGTFLKCINILVF
jgi:hypothetical protein